MAPKYDWGYEITEQDVKDVININTKITDLVKATEGGDVDGDKDGGSTPTPPSPKPGSTPPPPTPPGTPPPTPPTPPITPPPGGGKGTPPPGGSGAPSPSPLPMKGGHSTQTSRVRGIQSKFDGRYDFVDSTKWVRSGNSFPSWEVASKSAKWMEFAHVKNKLKKKWDRLSKEEISEGERGFLIGDEIDMDDYVAGKDKYFDRVSVPEKELAELNIIIALDASGSTGNSRQYNMSGLTFALKRALEELNVRHSLMVYDDEVSLLDVDHKGLSTNAMPLLANYHGMGGNNESMVLDIAGEIVRKNGDYKNVVLIISDGGVDDLRNGLKQLRTKTKGELNVYCIGYDKDFDEEYAADMFGKEFTIATHNAGDFAEKVITVLEKELKDALIVED